MGKSFVIAVLRFTVTTAIYVAYLALWKLCSVVNNVLNTYSGITNDVYRGRILLRRKLSTYHTSSPMDFLCFCTSRVKPEYVLRKNVALYCITETEAYFVETPKNVNINSSDENPFLYLAQYTRGINVIKMSINTFHTLSESIGDPNVPVIWISNIGRCGSTILCQVFERVPGTLVLSEPDTPLKVCDMQTLNIVTELEYNNIVMSMVRIICKPYPNAERIVIKTRSACAPLMLPLSKLFPTQVQQIFMYRDSLSAIGSWGASMGVTPYGIIIRTCADNEVISSLVPFFRKQFRFEIQSQLFTLPDIPLTNTFEQLVHMWAHFMILARHAISSDPNILPLRYEDILSQPTETVTKVFRAVRLNVNLVDNALAALKQDSQRGSALSGNLLKNSPRRQISTENRVVADRILSSYKLPRMGETLTLQN